MSPAVPTENEPRWTEFEQLMQGIGIALLTTREAGGVLHTRPLQTLRLTREALWFSTDCDSPKAADLHRDVHASVAYADIARHRYAAVSGTGRIRQDPALARELWQLDQRAYYPDGPDDPRLAVLEVAIERAEYWLAPGRGGYYLAAVRAAVTGQPVIAIGDTHKL